MRPGDGGSGQSGEGRQRHLHHNAQKHGRIARRSLPFPAPNPAVSRNESLIHLVYEALLKASPIPSDSPLIYADKQGLEARGFTRYERFGLLPGHKAERTRLLFDILSKLKIRNPAGVPGVWHSDHEWRLGHPYNQRDALMIPIRARNGHIRGIQLRYLTKNKDNRYRWLTSAKMHLGTPSQAAVHYLWPETTATKVMVTEGALKAETLALHYPQHRITGIPGLSIGLAVAEHAKA